MSLAYDYPIKIVSLLIGCRYFNAKISNGSFLDAVEPGYDLSSIGLFLKIRY